MRTVTIWHNIATDDKARHVAMMDGYEPGHPLVPVARYGVPDAIATANQFGVCEEAFHVFNVGDDPDFGPPDPRALEYRKRRNRSLSVGDVVQVTTAGASVWLACVSLGFLIIEEPRWFAIGASMHGTTSLDTDMFNHY